MFLDDRAWVAEKHSGLHDRNGMIEAFSGGFDHADGVRAGIGGASHVVCFVEVAMEAAVIEGYVKVEDVARLE